MTRITPAVARVALPYIREFVNDDRTPDDPEWGALFAVQCELEQVIKDAKLDFAPIDAIADAQFPKRERPDVYPDDFCRGYRIDGIEVTVTQDGDIGTNRFLVRCYNGKLTSPFTAKHRQFIRLICDEIDRQLGVEP